MSVTAEASDEAGLRATARIVYTREELDRRVRELGAEIAEFYRSRVASGDESLVVLGVLKGSFVFLADLVRAMEVPLHVDFVVASSYRDSTVTSGEVELLYEPDTSIQGRHVLLVEDIVDTGTTLERLLSVLQEAGAASVEVCALLRKEGAQGPGGELRPPRWVGFQAPDEFLVGYGLDYSENFRQLSHIATLKEPVLRDAQVPTGGRAPSDGQ